MGSSSSRTPSTPTPSAELLAEIDPFERELKEELRQLEGGKAFIARADEITFTTHLVTRSERLRCLRGGSAAGRPMCRPHRT